MGINIHYRLGTKVTSGKRGTKVSYELVFLARLPEFDASEGIAGAINGLIDWDTLDSDACGTFTAGKDQYEEALGKLKEIAGEEEKEAKDLIKELESLRKQVEEDGYLEIEVY